MMSGVAERISARQKSKRGRITKAVVDALKVRELVWDSELKGFGVRANANGSKTYLAKYRDRVTRKPRWFTIGRHGSPWTADKARETARDVLYEAGKGRDPAAEMRGLGKQPGGPTFRASVQLYQQHREPQLKPRTLEEIRRHLRHFVDEVGDRPLREISRRDITRVLDAIVKAGHGPQANRHKATISGFFKWVVGRGEVDASPVAHMPDPYLGEQPRERALPDDELAIVLKVAATTAWPYRGIVAVLALTGCRKSEVAGMRWDELDRATRVWTIPGERTKSGVAHVVPLSRAVEAVIDEAKKQRSGSPLVFVRQGSEQPFQNFGRAKRDLDKAIAKSKRVAAWRLHDLRRTVTSGLQRFGVEEPVLRAVLNHSPSSALGITAVYARHDFIDEKRQALDRWAAHVGSLLTPEADRANANSARQSSGTPSPLIVTLGGGTPHPPPTPRALATPLPANDAQQNFGMWWTVTASYRKP